MQVFDTVALPLIMPTDAGTLCCEACGNLYYPRQAWLHAACKAGSNGLPVFRDADGVKREGLVRYPVHRVNNGVLDGVNKAKSVNNVNKPDAVNNDAKSKRNAYLREYMAKRRATGA